MHEAWDLCVRIDRARCRMPFQTLTHALMQCRESLRNKGDGFGLTGEHEQFQGGNSQASAWLSAGGDHAIAGIPC